MATKVKVDLVPLGDRVMCIPAPVNEGTGVVGLGGEIVKTARTVASEEWQQSEVIVFAHGTGVPKWVQRACPIDSTVIVARHTGSLHRIPIGANVVEFLLVPSSGILMRKREYEVQVEVDEDPVVPLVVVQ